MNRRSLLVAGLGATLAACGRADARWTFSLSSQIDPARSGSWVWARGFLDALAGDGARVFPGSALGREDLRLSMVRQGLLEIDETSSDEVGTVERLAFAARLPFLFDDLGHFQRFVDHSDFLDHVNRHSAATGLRVLDVVFLGGMSGVFTTRTPLERLEDLSRIRLRGRQRHDLQLLKAWGVRSAQVAWEEIAQALSTDIVDGYLNPPLVPLIFGHQRQIRHFCDLAINPSARLIVVSQRWFDSLGAEGAARVTAAARAGRAANRDWAARIVVEERRLLEAAGVRITRLADAERRELSRRSLNIQEALLPGGDAALARRLAEAVR